MHVRILVVFEHRWPAKEMCKKDDCQRARRGEVRRNERVPLHVCGQHGGLHVATAATQRYGSALSECTELLVAQSQRESVGRCTSSKVWRAWRRHSAVASWAAVPEPTEGPGEKTAGSQSELCRVRNNNITDETKSLSFPLRWDEWEREILD